MLSVLIGLSVPGMMEPLVRLNAVAKNYFARRVDKIKWRPTSNKQLQNRVRRLLPEAVLLSVSSLCTTCRVTPFDNSKEPGTSVIFRRMMEVPGEGSEAHSAKNVHTHLLKITTHTY